MFVCKFTVVKNFLCVTYFLLAAELQCDKTFICEIYKVFIIDGSNHDNGNSPSVNEPILKTLYTDSSISKTNPIES